MKKCLQKLTSYVIVIYIILNYMSFVTLAGFDRNHIGLSKETQKNMYQEGMPVVRRQVFPEDEKDFDSSLRRTMKQKSKSRETTNLPLKKELPAPVNINNIVIFLRFKGEAEFVNDKNRNLFRNHYNGKDISLSSYMKDVSYGQFNVVSNFFPLQEDGEFCSYQAKNSRSYYQPYSSQNLDGYSKSSSDDREFSLLSEVVSYCKPMIEKRYEKSSDLDFSENGKVDNIVFVVSGKEDTWEDLLWPHQFAIPDTDKYQNVVIHGKKVGVYNLMLESCFKENNIGTSVHEFLHTKGFPDFYRYKSKGTPVGHWDLMSEQHAIPQFPLVYPRYKYGAFCNKSTPITKGGRYCLYPSTSKDFTKEISYMLKSPTNSCSEEYFIVEYRAPKKIEEPVISDLVQDDHISDDFIHENREHVCGFSSQQEVSQDMDGQYFWDESLQDEGLLVYRVNKMVKRGNAASNGDSVPDKIFIFRKGITNPILADGDIEKSALLKTGDSLGVIDEDYDGEFIAPWEDIIYFSDGENSGIRLYDIEIDKKEKKAFFKVEFSNTSITRASLKSAKTTIDHKNKKLLFDLNKNFSETFVVPNIEHNGGAIFQSEEKPAEKMPLIISDNMSYEIVSSTGIRQEWKVITSPVGEIKKEDIKVDQSKAVALSCDLMNPEGVTYQWYCDKKPIDGETDAKVILRDPGDGKKHNYYVLASNEAGEVKCAKTTVQWVDPSRKTHGFFSFIAGLKDGLSPRPRTTSFSTTRKNMSPMDTSKEKSIRRRSLCLSSSDEVTSKRGFVSSRSMDFDFFNEYQEVDEQHDQKIGDRFTILTKKQIESSVVEEENPEEAVPEENQLVTVVEEENLEESQ